MNTLQSLVAIIALIFALSVIVQAIQEFIKDFLQTKPKAMMQALVEFMGDKLSAAAVAQALSDRGLDVTALEQFSSSDFRDLLDAVPLDLQKVQTLVQGGQASLDKIKDNIAGAYQGALARFNQIYTKKNKQIAVLLSAIVVFALNANVIILYENISSDPSAQQKVVDKVLALNTDPKYQAANKDCQEQTDLPKAYAGCRLAITNVLNADPILLRTRMYCPDYWGWPKCFLFFGLFVMVALVSLGAPFWNDVLKGATGLNNALNGNANKS
jgi:hypothetical protein